METKRDSRWNLLVVLGPTASGKTDLAVLLARRVGGEIISADSRQVYRGMDLGTGKDLAAYGSGLQCVPFHLIDICEPEEEFSLFSFCEGFHACFRAITDRRRIPILAGGTGLYLDAVLRGYRMVPVPEDPLLRDRLAAEGMEALKKRLLDLCPELHNSTDLKDRSRLIRAIEIARESGGRRQAEPHALISPLVIGIRFPREELRRRITARLEARLAAGMVDEVRGLHERGVPWQRLEALGLEYRYIGLHLQGRLTFEEMFATLNTKIHQFAKRQETWFRGMERKGVPIRWIDGPDVSTALALLAGPAS
jgi:tRNA dimethylallyltransferase